MKIDEEIRRYFLKYRVRDIVIPDNSLPDHLKELQYYVILTHTVLDIDMLVRILCQIRYKAGDQLDSNIWNKINLIIQDALDQIQFMFKLNLIEQYDDFPDQLAKALKKVNILRIEFAHPKNEILIKKYDNSSRHGKIQIRNLFRALERAQILFLNYTENSEACKYYVKKQLEYEKSTK